MYLLDTNALSDYMQAKPRLAQWMLRLTESDQLATCTIVRGEILFGIARLLAGARQAELQKRADTAFAHVTCEPIPASAAPFYARIKASRRQQGRPLGDNDLWIAATALALDATLVTRDRDFSGIEGLQMIDLT
jgi:predicted nucleic acid-binding protein